MWIPQAFLSAISIHAPRTGSDHHSGVFSVGDDNFNPRSPHGERLGWSLSSSHQAGISIHAPRTGSDPSPWR